MGKQGKNTKNGSATVYADHAEQDAALKSPQEKENKGPGLTTVGQVGLFILFPLTVGVAGLYVGYLSTLKDKDRKLSIDQDFVMPFLLALTMVIVVSIQTDGFRQKKVKPLVPWPKVKRVKKVVVVDDEGNAIEDHEGKKEQ